MNLFVYIRRWLLVYIGWWTYLYTLDDDELTCRMCYNSRGV